MNCHQCGNPLPGGAKFCPNCGEPVPTSAIPPAQILDFSPYAAERTRHFKGREWVFKVVDDWLAKPDASRYLLLTGEPGCGKTTTAAQIFRISQGKAPIPSDVSRITPHLLSAAHFCSARDSTWIDPRIFARSVSLQLAGKFKEFSQALIDTGEKTTLLQAQLSAGEVKDHALVAGFIIHNLILSGGNSQEAFNRTVAEPLQAIFNKGFSSPILILADGLDESLHHGRDVTISMLLSRLKNLPSQVRFILTSRPEPKVENEFPDADTLFLSAADFDEHNRKDVKTYVEWRFKQDNGLAKIVAQTDAKKVAASVETITQKSEGNFRYVTFLLDAMAKGQRALDDLEGIPAGLDGLYYDSLKRVLDLGKKDWAANYAPFLGVLSVAQTSLTHLQIGSFSGLSEGTVWACLGDLQQFVEVVQSLEEKGEDRYRFYHQSVIDFLQNRQLNVDRKRLHNLYCLPPEEWHRKISFFYVNAYGENWSLCDSYGLKYLLDHVVNANLEKQERVALLERILTGQFMKTLQERFGRLDLLVETLYTVGKVHPERTVTMCLKVLLQSWPNSRVFQRVLQLLRELRPRVDHFGDELSSHHRAVDAMVTALAEPPATAVQLLEEQLHKVKNPRLRGIIALALGETGSQRVRDELVKRLQSERRSGSWMAADGLIALNDAAVIPQLVQWYHETQSGADRERILYILGRMHAEEARALLSDGLSSSRYKNVGRAVDLMRLLSPVESDIPYLQGKLHSILASDPRKPEGLGPWRNEWVQKRLVRTLQRRGVVEALPDLRRLQDHVARRGEPKNSVERGSSLVATTSMPGLLFSVSPHRSESTNGSEKTGGASLAPRLTHSLSTPRPKRCTTESSGNRWMISSNISRACDTNPFILCRSLL